MDRNSIIGLVLIALLVIGYSIFMQPSEEEIAARKRQLDSIEQVSKSVTHENVTLPQQAASADTNLSDSVRQNIAVQKMGSFAPFSSGTEKNFSLENDLIKISFTNKGAAINSVVLKKYKTNNGRPVILMQDDSSFYNLTFPAQNRTIESKDLYFETNGVQSGGDSSSISFKVSLTPDSYIEYRYSLKKDSYLSTFNITMHRMGEYISPSASYFEFDWKQRITPKEQSIKNERAATTVYYKFSGEDVDYLSYGESAAKSLKTRIQWVALKQQFFSSVLIADDYFDAPNVESFYNENDTNYVKSLSASFTLPYDRKESQSIGMKFYFGPNHFQTLKKLGDYQLEKQINLGWGIFGWVNRFLVIPVFNFLNSFNLNFGIIILILTIIVRVVLLPLTFGSYKSQAKMKVLQPEVKEINEKHADDAMKKQQEMMALYRRAGVNPLGGCIPGLLQLPILIAMFSFFPASIELRQESFLWAKDLSTYDSILDLPFNIPFYGAHVSLFTLLMTLSTVLFTRINMQMTSAANPQLKWMMYIMPVLFLGVFNNYSAGLSYYYFLSNLFGLGQQYMFKFFIDENEIHRKIQENKKKPVKKSNFQKRLEQMAKGRGYKGKK